MAIIGDYYEFQNGFAFKSKDFEENGKYKIVKIKELKDGEVKFFTDTASITPEKGFDVEKYLIKKGDVLFALTGDPVSKSNPLSWVGRVSYYDKDEPALLNQRVCKVVPKNGASKEFIYYFFRQYTEFYNLAAKATGSASQANISTKTIEQHPVEMPGEEDVKKGTLILRNSDKKINVNQMMIENLQTQIETHYYAWFTSFEQFSDSLIEGEYGLQPSDWSVKELKDVTQNMRDKVNDDEGYTVLSAVNTGILKPADEYFSKQVYSKSINNYLKVEEYDFAYNPARVNIGSIGINDLGIKGCVSPVYVVFRTEKGYENYMKLFIKSERFRNEVNMRASGSVRQSMNYSDFGFIKIIYPTKLVIEQFNHVISPLTEYIEYLKKENDNLRELRDISIPKLLRPENID